MLSRHDALPIWGRSWGEGRQRGVRSCRPTGAGPRPMREPVGPERPRRGGRHRSRPRSAAGVASVPPQALSVRAVLDVNVIISAVLSPSGRPAEVLRRWLDGSVELVVSPMLLEELDRALGHKKLASRVRSEEHTSELQSLMRNSYAVFF